MAFDRIPMPQTGMDAFLQGLTTSQSMFNSIMENKLNPYKAQLMKSQAQEAQGKAQESQMWSNLFNLAGGLPGTIDPSTGANNIPMQSVINPSQQQSQPIPPPQTPANASGMTRGQLVARANQDQANYDQNNNVNTSTQPSVQPFSQNMPGSNTNTQAPKTGNDVLKQLARRMIAAKMGVNPSPPVIQNGRIIQFDPLTNEPIIGQQVSESAPEKRAAESETKANELRTADDIKSDQSDIATARALTNSTKHLSDIADVIHNPANKNLTGLAYSLPGGETAAKNFGGGEMGKFLSATGLLQADAAKTEAAGNGRGAGIGLVNFFKNIKPDIKNGMAVNQGMVDQLIDDTKNRWDNSKSSWDKRNPGKSFPVPRPDFENIVPNAIKKYASNNNATSNPEGVFQGTKTIGNQEFHKINGKWFPVIGQ